jgi:two-component system CAI-1 autoinducer sensor kinase/phosphatase CqsS
LNFVRGLFAHYKLYHQHGPLMLKYAGLLGAFGFPIFYLLRFTRSSSAFDDLWIRLVATLLCVLLVLKDRWPERLKPYYIAFSYPALIFSLPTALVFTSLKNGGGAGAVGNTLMVVFFVILMTDWRNTIVMLVVGIGSAVLLYFVFDPNASIPMDYLGRLPLLILVVIGGSFFKFAGNRAAAEQMRQGYASIAGSIAHEMRNPLSQIKHSLEGMQQALPAPTTSRQSQTLPPREVDDLYRYLAESELAVKRGLQVSAMTLDEVSEKPMDTAAFSYLSAAEATYKAVQEYGYDSDVDRGKVSVQVTEDFSFRGDETAYLFVLFNLIKNALYYIALCPQAQVTITVEGQQVKVRDTGPGIAPDVLVGLFEPFRSVGKSGGTGLGLAYCQRVMHGFGGQISCRSVVGEYTEFVLRFPPISEQESQAHRLAVLDRARAAFAGKRLLIVDDDSIQRMTTRHKLSPLGATLDEAADGRRALEMVARHSYDLILLDLKMPVLDGYAVAEEIRRTQAPTQRYIPIVAYTSEPSHLASVKTQKAGMDGFVSKPCAQLALLQVLEQALAHPAARTQPDGMPLSGRRVLLADDSAHNRRAVAAYLKHGGATVVEVSHGRAVLEHLRAPGHWDAVLTDINMPGMNGLETTRAIRGSGEAWCNIPIVALTAHADEDTARAARAAGMNDFMSKPVEPGVLYAKLCSLFNDGVAADLAAAQPMKSEAAAKGGERLLNLERLESYRRLGMLQELLTDYLPEIARLVDKLELSAAGQDLEASLDALHSLLGMSGDAGAQALYRLVRGFYVPMVEARAWPLDKAWLAQIRATAAQAEKALKAYDSAQSAVTAV